MCLNVGFLQYNVIFVRLAYDLQSGKLICIYGKMFLDFSTPPKGIKASPSQRFRPFCIYHLLSCHVPCGYFTCEFVRIVLYHNGTNKEDNQINRDKHAYNDNEIPQTEFLE